MPHWLNTIARSHAQRSAGSAGSTALGAIGSRGKFVFATAMLIALTQGGCATRVFDLQGHRGARGLAPENTLPAFATALSLGVVTLELDTGITRDGVIVVSHDPFVNPDIARGPDGAWLKEKGPPISKLSYAELQRYDFGRVNPESRYAKTLPDQKPVDGTRMPRLSEVFALTRRARNYDVRFNIETKTSPVEPDQTLPPDEFVERLLAVIDANGISSQVTIQSFDWRTLQRAQQIAPDIPTVYLSAQQKFFDNIAVGKPEGSPWVAGFQAKDHGDSVPRMVHAAGGRVWSPYFGDIDQHKVDEAHALGESVVVWTVNKPEDIDRMLEMKVDGIISDRPDLVRAAMTARGMPLPKATPVSP